MEPNGMFMDAVRRELPLPPAAQTLGFEVLSVEPHLGRIEVAFEGTEAFTNPYGEIVGGFLAAMLYDTVGPALLVTLSQGEFIVTHQLRVDFIRPAPVGRLVGRGRIASRDGDTAQLEATLSDRDGHIVATAQATAHVVQQDQPQE